VKSETLSAHCALVAGLLCLSSAQPVAAQDTDAGGQSAPGPRSFGEIPQVQAEVTVDGEELVVMKESDIFGIIEYARAVKKAA